MAGKKFDVKQFLLQRGEFVGLGVAGSVVVLLLLLSVVKIFGSPDIGKDKEQINQGVTQINTKLKSDTPSDPNSYLAIDPKLNASERQTVSAEPYYLATNYFIPKGDSEMKRRPVQVQVPTEFRVEIVRAQLRAYALRHPADKPNSPPDSVVMIKGAGGGGAGRPGGGSMDLSSMLMPRGAGGRPGGGGVGLLGPMGPSGGGSGSGQPYGPGMGGVVQGGGQEKEAPENTKLTAVTVKLTEMNKDSSLRLAEEILPVRMAIITASFPYRKQVEEFQNKLQYRTLDDLFRDQASMPTFLWKDKDNKFQGGITLQRVELDAAGKPKMNRDGKVAWETIDEKLLTRCIVMTGKRLEPENPELQGLVLPGMVWGRPLQFSRDGAPADPAAKGRYPEPELELPGIKSTLATAKAANPQFRPKSPFDPEDINVYGGTTGAGGNTGTGDGGYGSGQQTTPMGTGAGTGTGTGTGDGNLGQSQLQQVPEYCLIRVIDPTIQPGVAYNYQIQIKMKNPNHGKQKDVMPPSAADKAEVVSPWVLVRDDRDAGKPPEEQAKVKVGSEAFIYAVDQAQVDSKSFTGSRNKPDPAQTVVQIHRWLDTVKPEGGAEFRLGEWLIGERLFVSRGEYVNKADQVEVPIWLMLEEKWGLKPFKKTNKVPVQFNLNNGSGDVMLVDFQGGDLDHRKLTGTKDDPKNPDVKIPQYDSVKDKAPTELILMSPTGKLVVRNSAVDAADAEREARHKEWKDRVKSLGQGDKPGEKPNIFGNP